MIYLTWLFVLIGIKRIATNENKRHISKLTCNINVRNRIQANPLRQLGRVLKQQIRQIEQLVVLHLMLENSFESADYDLDISRRQLTKISSDQLEQIQILNVSGNPGLKQADIKLLLEHPSLTHLNISSCQIKYLMNFNYSQSKLRCVDASFNQLDSSAVFKLSQIQSLEMLDLSDNDLKVYPTLSDDTKLQHLVLSQNNFKNRTADVLQLASIQSLEKLDISLGELNIFPTFPLETKLKQISFYKTAIDKASDLSSVLRQQHLEYLDIKNCYCKFSADFEPSMSKLELLNAPNNRFPTKLLNNIAQIQTLTKIDLSSCNLQQIPRFSLNSSLKYLILSNNKLSHDYIGLAIIFGLPNLMHLEMIRCGISGQSFPFQFGGKLLRNLIISDHDVKHTGQFWTWLPSLKQFNATEVDFTEHKLESIANQFYEDRTKFFEAQRRYFANFQKTQIILIKNLSDITSKLGVLNKDINLVMNAIVQ